MNNSMYTLLYLLLCKTKRRNHFKKNKQTFFFFSRGETPYGSWIYILMYLGAIAGLTTVALTVLLSQTRVFYAMGLDGLLPEFFTVRHHTTEIPWISTVISGRIQFSNEKQFEILCFFLLLLGSFCAVISAVLPADLADDMSSIAALVTYIFVHINVTVVCIIIHVLLRLSSYS